MSLDLSRDALERDKENELQTIILARKRKLAHLYAVTCSPDPIPELDAPAPDSSPSTALASFLDTNDLIKGRYLQEASLPEKFQREFRPIRVSPQHFAPSPPTHQQTVAAAAAAAATTPTATTAEGVWQREGKEGEEAEAGEEKGSGQHQQQPPESHSSIGPHLPKPQVTDSEGTPPRQVTATDEAANSQPASGKPYRETSWPQSQDARPRIELDPSSKLAEPSLTSNEHVSTPSSAGPKSANTSRTPATSPEVDTPQSRNRASRSRSPAAAQPTLLEGHNSNLKPPDGDALAVPSGAAKHSKNANSQDALPGSDDDKEANDSTSGEHDRSRRRLDTGAQDAPPLKELTADSRTQNHANSAAHADRHRAKRPRLDGEPSPHASTTPASVTTHRFPNIPDNSPDNIARLSAPRSPRAHGALVGKARWDKIAIQSDDPAAPQDTSDEWKTKRRLPRSSATRSKASKVGKATMMKRLPGRSYANLTQSFLKLGKPNDSRPSSARRDYMQMMFLKQASDQQYKADLPALLNSSAKTLVTTDWQASLREKQDVAVVRRVYEWQQNRRWSLRQPKPFPEPPAPETHQRHLLSEMKWLRADFKEERKQKLMSAHRLACSCKRWVESDPSTRGALQLGGLSPLSFFGGKGSKAVGSSGAIAQSTVTGESMDAGSVAGKASGGDASNEIFTDAQEQLPSDDPQESNDTGWNSDPERTAKPPHEIEFGMTLQKSLPKLEAFAGVSYSESDSRGVEKQVQKLQDLDLQSLLSSPAEFRTRSSNQSAVPHSLPPDEQTTALFDPEWQPLRKRCNAQWPFKPPSNPLPPVPFYENRKSSYWTHEDDQSLRSFSKDFPSNWDLIADRMAPKSIFSPSPFRRTPWECYERLSQIEGQQAADSSNRMYAKQFQTHLEKVRQKYQATSAQQQPRAPSHPLPPFPTPQRVERKNTKKFHCMVEAARKLARKRETASGKQQPQHPDNSLQSQRPATQSNGSPPTPLYLSKMKYDRQVREIKMQETIRMQQKAAVQAHRQQQQQSGNQSSYGNNAAQRNGNSASGNPSGFTTANGHLAVPGSTQAKSQGHGTPAVNLPNGLPATSQMAQRAVNGRPQAVMQGNQRLPPQFSTTPQMTEQGLHHFTQQAQQQQSRSTGPYSNQRQMNQAQLGNGSPNMTNMNTFSNPGNLNHPNNIVPQAANPQSPSLQQQMGLNLPPSGSPDPANHGVASNVQQMPDQSQQQQMSRPTTLSSGHVPTVNAIQHQIQQSRPHLSTEEAKRQAGDELHKQLFDLSRRNALNAATGGYHSQQRLQQQNQQRARQPQVSAHSLFPHQSDGGDQHSPYLQNGVGANGNNQGRSSSPGNPSSHQHNQQYARQYSQNVSMGPPGMASPGSNPAQLASPAMNMSPTMPFPAVANRPPTPSQNHGSRPLSGNANVSVPMGVSQYDQKRPGSAQPPSSSLSAQSPGMANSQTQ
ncbi:MAG: chromatin modification- protein VID21 [Alyxoria varia]|nr:MAG: chromatin modification- protein VID21 [Alyxoria varia]